MRTAGPSLVETLPAELQAALNEALEPGEPLLVALRCGTRQVFAATTRRLFVLTEPLVTGVGPVAVRMAPLESVSNLRAEARPVGGRLRWDTDYPDAPTAVEYPTYEGARFELAALRLRGVLENDADSPRGSGVGEDVSEGAMGSSSCPKCDAEVPAGGCWCPSCGLQVADPCGECGRVLPEGGRFCTYCGTAATEPAIVTCGSCTASVGPGHGFCTACGEQARPLCSECDRPLRRGWQFCPRCGGAPNAAPSVKAETRSPVAVAAPAAGPVSRGIAPPDVAPENLNAAGVRAYEAERYEEAVSLFRQAVDGAPKEARFWVNLGVAYGELGEDDRAAEVYRKVLMLDARNVSAHLQLGYVYMQQERSNEAREMWERVVQLAPDSEEAREARENLQSADEI